MSKEGLLFSPEQPEALIGKSAVDVIHWIFWANPSIMAGYVYPYQYVAGLPHRRPLDTRAFHQFGREEVGLLQERINLLPLPGWDVGFVSRVEVLYPHIGQKTGDVLRNDIPFIDFQVSVNAENLAKVVARLAKFRIGPKPVIWAVLDSGRSYHGYCLNYLLEDYCDPTRAIGFYAEQCRQNLDYSEAGQRDSIIDGWFFLHSLQQDNMILRLTNNAGKIKVPEVAAVVRSS